jgi:hypothetical protein
MLIIAGIHNGVFSIVKWASSPMAVGASKAAESTLVSDYFSTSESRICIEKNKGSFVDFWLKCCILRSTVGVKVV